MKSSDQKHRIIFIDLMRAFAVLQMVQGHTINVLLAEQYRNADYIFYAVWNFMRGMTAPIFMFTAGTVFTYLFRSVQKPFNENPRVKKGIKRGLLLIGIGYLLRYPTWTVFDFSEVSELSWQIFQAVDVLQLIGISLLILLLVLYFVEKTKLSDTILFAVAASLIFFSSPFIEKINWLSYFPQFIASYFYSGTGSLFPVFPWAAYVIAGGVLGSYLGKNPHVFKTKKFSLLLAVFGCAFMIISYSSELVLNLLNVTVTNIQTDPGVIVFRVGFVLGLNAIVSFIALKVDRIPQLLILVGRNTLLIYVVHLLLLYGSAWNP
ncbi:MAG: DUF1624 domain-containing protein, partial [Ignavibacteriaceae bacterium]|nr:DUF1624 domain-containing protein [Ignavibacteriaceae bacterium]